MNVVEEAANLIGELAHLPVGPFKFCGYPTHRDVVGFGYHYHCDYISRTVRPVASIPRSGSLSVEGSASLRRATAGEV